MDNLVNNYGWWLLALVLIAAEMLAPGYFLLWIGIAAGVMGLVTLVMPGLPALAQAVLFGVLAIAACLVYWRYIRPVAEQRNDQPLLNKRGAQLIGRRFVLAEAIVNGRGKVKVGDSEWLAEGPDLPVGSEVEVVAVEGVSLKVQTPH
ncbi:NfeD family protein [Dokdonella sp.]|uniref:NfeD family protein n=1 Tax=Dokdonella sp. TaxID=2291710 RepID=UPI001B20CCBA|nr:NfeD family protein [Dokdonella sp.]MBO9664876.1 NfeD family protein [Dokdonella sp.]